MNFEDLNLHPTLLKAIREQNYTVPTPIQEKAIPLVLDGGDVLGCAQTGTGKTAAFALPILQNLSTNRLPLSVRQNGRRPIRTLVLAPTRELALQIHESFVAYGRYTGLRTTYIFGGVSQNPQVKALEQGVDILVATPGRLLDLMSQNFVDLRTIEVFVLDEADRMLDMGFIHDIRKVVAALPRKRQTLLFSATLLPEIRELASGMLNNPRLVSVAPPASTVDMIDQSVHFVERTDKIGRLIQLLENPDVDRALVFTRTKYGADKVVRKLTQIDIKAAAIHGNKSQNNRQAALEGFKTGRMRVLVATDIAARGLDIDDVSHVFNLDLPFEPECYVHRIGRTARAGRDGVAVSFCSSEERSLLTAIERMIHKQIAVVGPVPGAARPTDINAIRRNDRAERRADDASGESGKTENPRPRSTLRPGTYEVTRRQPSTTDRVPGSSGRDPRGPGRSKASPDSSSPASSTRRCHPRRSGR